MAATLVHAWTPRSGPTSVSECDEIDRHGKLIVALVACCRTNNVQQSREVVGQNLGQPLSTTLIQRRDLSHTHLRVACRSSPENTSFTSIADY